ncbi:hypothetical protein Tco_0431427 [Tanacetum coccineum]|uniref:Uncharacterized protein n=1 Tax=Tanacetum coccineum TaxID=301880 RepID=A0ABQ5ADN9_9ASTR
MSKKQDCTIMSSAEAEYVALSASCAQVIWMRIQLRIMALITTKYRCTATLSQPQQSHATPCNTPVQSTSILDTTLSRNRLNVFEYLVSRILMRCLTPAELEVLANETA